jgi:phosphatidylethanolamine/phosphatidyl-N-methylethanolamine N-methyltransferase
MNENIQFLQAFLKNPTKVGSIAPSSPDLAMKMIEGFEPGPDNIILELGVGTGAITKYINDIVPDANSYLGLELDEKLVGSLKPLYPNLRIEVGNACEAFEVHKRSGLGKVGAIVSCLPFVSLPNEVGEKILLEAEKFMKLGGCTFRAIQYAHGYYFPSAIKMREFMRNRYGKSKRSTLIVKNVPPSYTVTWSTN